MWTVLDSPVGDVRVVADGTAVVAVHFLDERAGPAEGRSAASSAARAAARANQLPAGERADANPLLRRCVEELESYFAGDLEDFDVPLQPRGTPFQLSVWEQLRAIGYGETATYGDVARRLGLTASASRAVGLANGSNPLPIMIPCHRVVGSKGALTGYAGGVQRKQLLLDLERGSLF